MPVKPDHLKTYRKKRDFKVTPEPQGGAPSRIKKLRYVIQKHDATRLHYDFRLESDGALISWAVPKGPSTQPADKRLAVMTEDHPLDYAKFEGNIPEGEYGGGPVIVWDEGRYVNLTEKNGKVIPLREGIRKGHIHFWLQGKKLNGGWTMVRLHDGKEKNWLLIKSQDAGVNFPPDPVKDQPQSVLSGRTVEQIGANRRSRVWHSNR